MLETNTFCADFFVKDDMHCLFQRSHLSIRNHVQFRGEEDSLGGCRQ